jgi:hypothetical protein
MSLSGHTRHTYKQAASCLDTSSYSSDLLFIFDTICHLPSIW